MLTLNRILIDDEKEKGVDIMVKNLNSLAPVGGSRHCRSSVEVRWSLSLH
jgi:hypothetical protein